MQYLEYINQGMLTLSAYIVILICMAVFYYRQKVAAYQAATLVAVQYTADALLLPIIYQYPYFGYYGCYMAWSFTATYVVLMLFIRVYNGNLKVTLVEYTIVTLELFLVMCMTCRFIDVFLLSNAGFSKIYIYICDAAYLLLMITVLLPALKMIINKIGLQAYLDKTGVKPAFANILNYDITKLIAKRG